jgi:hypothetical protein
MVTFNVVITSSRGLLFEMLIVDQIGRKFAAFYGTIMFIALFTAVCHVIVFCVR